MEPTLNVLMAGEAVTGDFILSTGVGEAVAGHGVMVGVGVFTTGCLV